MNKLKVESKSVLIVLIGKEADTSLLLSPSTYLFVEQFVLVVCVIYILF